MKKNRLSHLINTLTEKRLNMNFALFKQKYRDSENTKTVFMAISLMLLVLVILQQCKINSQHERLVIVPPTLTKEAKLSWDSANQNYMNDLALYIASQISSATPKTVDYVIGAMEGYFDPHIWQQLKPQLEAVKVNMNYAGINAINQFTPTGGVIFEPETGKVFVVGEITSYAYSTRGMQQPGSTRATYEMKINIHQGIPRITEWFVYPGQAMTEEWKKKNPHDWEKEEPKRQVAYIPMVPDSVIQRESGQNTITMGLDSSQVSGNLNDGQQGQDESLPPTVPQANQQLDPFSQAEQQANQAMQQQQQMPQQQLAPQVAPVMVLPQNNNHQAVPQANPNTPSSDDDTL